MARTLRVLHIEDSELDVVLLSRHLSRAGYELVSERVDKAAAMKASLGSREWDLILCDYSMPHFDALSALALLKETGRDIPFIIISGTIGELIAVEAMRLGAHDYLMKDNLLRLVPAIERELQEADNRHARRQAEDELRDMTQQLLQAAKLATMGELAACIAHELNNPLATISLRAKFLIDELTGDESKRYAAQIIDQEVDRMATLVGKLLQFSRRSHPEICRVDLREELSKSLQFIDYHLPGHKISVIKEFDIDLPSVLADRQQLRQVFLNLQTNASDAMPEGGTLIVRARPGTLGNGAPAVVVEFSDTGTGIQPEHLPQLWEAFFTTKPEGKGTGLGLSICRRAVEAHRGIIEIEGLPGKGATVRIMLPASVTENIGNATDQVQQREPGDEESVASAKGISGFDKVLLA
jgi:signal transduction histidine kinase